MVTVTTTTTMMMLRSVLRTSKAPPRLKTTTLTRRVTRPAMMKKLTRCPQRLLAHTVDALFGVLDQLVSLRIEPWVEPAAHGASS